MKEYKLKQKIYNRLAKHDDYLEDIHADVRDMDRTELLQTVKNYFIREQIPVFPAKSYAVAVIYALLLGKYFAEDPIESLSDPDLFLGTDKYFKTYLQEHVVYDEILNFLNENNLADIESIKISQVQKTVEYFHKEFMWEEEIHG